MWAVRFRAGAALAAAMLAGLVPGTLARTGQDRPSGAVRVDFTREIRPLLSDRCFRCHGPDPGKRKAKLRLDTSAGAFKLLDDGWAIVKAGDPARSEVVRRITSDDPDEVMPPPESHLTLSEAERTLLERWVSEGAEYRPHWSLAPVGAAASLPPVNGPSMHPIDGFVRARLERDGLSPAPEASREALIRRLALNLTGLPPTVAEVDAFLADRSPGAYERVVDRYLGSPAYGERMATDWLDLARYADTYGYQADVERDMSPYRDWVIDAFNDNLPYDEFLVWQLAGDLLPSPTRAQRIATAFNRLHRQTNEGGSIEEEFRTEYVADRVNTFATSMLGLTMECARCHDHKFDPLTQRDYFSMFAFFNNIDESGLYSHFTSATPSPSLLLWPAAIEARHRALTARMDAAEASLEAALRTARQPFLSWLPTARLETPAPIAHLAFSTVNTGAAATAASTPDSVSGRGATLHDEPRLVPVQEEATRERSTGAGSALQFSGDNSVVHDSLRLFTRTDAFSIRVRLRPTQPQDRAVVLHQSRAWSDAGSRGFELTLDHGRPFFALIHFWPGNAIAVRARQPLPIDEWSTLTVSYDGSSRAAGIGLFANGAPLETEVVRDHLFKDIAYDRAAGDNVSKPPRFTIGARFRDSGFKNGLIDDLQVFDTRLTAAEVAGTLSHDADDPAALDHFLSRVHAPFMAARAELARLRRRENALVAGVKEIMVMEEMPEPRVTRLLTRGAYDAPGAVVPRDTPSSLPPFPRDQPRNRLGLARWLTDRGHPLTARVVVNRIWRMHFGRGIVATQEDFGSQGRLPTHPELLDWLAARFMDDGWDIKALHRLIVTSATFKQSSHVSDDGQRDPENLLLARGPKTRLLAEQVRDSALAASGLLVPTRGGPSVKPYQPAGLWEQAGTGKKYVQDTGDKLYRRSLYTFWRRTLPPPSMVAFDAMSREVCTAKRDVTTTPLQSLVLLNDPQFVESARVLAQRVHERFPSQPPARIRAAFRALLSRAPDETEQRILARLFAEQRDVFVRDHDAAAQLLGIGAAARNPQLPRVEVAAMTAVVSAIMNMDEFVVVR